MASSQRDQQKEVVRLLSIEHGFKKASELANVDYAVVRQWAVRGNWKQKALSQSVTSPATIAADKVAQEIQANGRQTKLSLSRSARRMAKDAESAKLRHSPYVHKVAQTAALVNPELYSQPDHGSTNVMVNIALLGVKPEEVMIEAVARTIDQQSSGTGDPS